MLIQGYPDPGAGLRLHLNENTGGCSPRVIDAIRRLKPTDISTYPSYPDLVMTIARYFDVDPEGVLLTNGLDEGILMAAVGHISKARIHGAEAPAPTRRCRNDRADPGLRSLSEFDGGGGRDGDPGPRQSGPELSDRCRHPRDDPTDA